MANLQYLRRLYGSRSQMATFFLLHFRETHRSSTLFPWISPYLKSSSSDGPSSGNYLNYFQKYFFSSNSSSILELILDNEWNEEIMNKLEETNPNLLTQESIIYILKKLDKNPQSAFKFFNWFINKNGSLEGSAAYSLMLRILAQPNMMKAFWYVVKIMVDKSIVIDEETYRTLFSQFSNLKMGSEADTLKRVFWKMTEKNCVDPQTASLINRVLGLDLNENLCEQLKDVNVIFTHSNVDKVLMSVKEHPLKALAFFQWAHEQPSYKHSASTYKTMLRILSWSKDSEKFWVLYEEMKREGHEIDIDTYTKISRQFQKKIMLGDATRLYEIMMDSPYKPSTQDCYMLLRKIFMHEEEESLGLANRVLNKYKETGQPLSKVIYDIIHRYLTTHGKFDQAEKIIYDMRNDGFEPDNITYSQVVFGLCKFRRFKDAFKVFDEMESLGCFPDVVTWTILIEGLLQAGEINEALSCLTKMNQKKCMPDKDLLNTLVRYLCDNNKVEEAYALLLEMVNKHLIVPLETTYRFLVQKLLEDKQFRNAMKVLDLMKSHRYPPSAKHFDDYISKYGTVDDALEFLGLLTGKDSPSPQAYVYIYRAFIKEGRHEDAFHLFYQSPHHVRKHVEVQNLFNFPKHVSDR